MSLYKNMQIGAKYTVLASTKKWEKVNIGTMFTKKKCKAYSSVMPCCWQ
jgi:hypothetical protein